MNEEVIQDLKQFIEATVSQQMAGLATKEDVKALDAKIDRVDAKIDRLDKKVDAIQDAIAETMTHANEAMDATLQDHERRLTRLEHRSA
jgi:peptidoglycan hydrolase CwlO-like protein